MSEKIPAIEQYMTNAPFTIASERPLDEAELLMQEHHIRHLPVVDGDVLVGILSDGDIHLARSLRGAKGFELRVEEAMTKSPYSVPKDTALDAVAEAMSTFRYGSAVVTHAGKVVGIFTAGDGLRVLVEKLRAV